MSSNYPATSSQQAFATPQPAPVPRNLPSPTTGVPPQAASPPSKQNLRSWWKGFKGQNKQPEIQAEPSTIFGVPLRQSITYANVAISLVDPDGRTYIYGYVPIVVAKCGVYLKEKATNVEGIFRLSGSEKRIKELRVIFDSPDRYGKGLDWEGYTVHDAANVLRRYLNQLPEPIVPLDLYDRFREPLRGHAQAAVGDQQAGQAVGTFNLDNTIAIYQQLITELPPLNRQLLLYILDLLAVFASKSDENRMTSANLAAIFQPGMLSHPIHDMAPMEYRLSQDVLVFLIENQDHFLIGMRGTAADEQTVSDVQNGGTPPPGTPNSPALGRGKSFMGRSTSNASAGADSLRKQGGIRRNVSVNSRHSRQSNGAPSPASPAYGTPLTHSSGGGVHRSNTVPSKKSPGLPAVRLQKSPDSRSPGIPAVTTEDGPLRPGVLTRHVLSDNAVAPQSNPEVSALPGAFVESAAGESQDQLLLDTSVGKPELPTQRTLFQRSPTAESDKRAPNKLRKKRAPDSSNPSAHSSVNSLQGQPEADSASFPQALPHESVEHRRLDTIHSANPSISNTQTTPPLSEHRRLDTIHSANPSISNTQASPLLTEQQIPQPGPGLLQPQGQPQLLSDNSVKPQGSRNSLRSRESNHEQSDNDHGDDPVVVGEQKEKRRLFRLSRRKDDLYLGTGMTSPPKRSLGSNGGADTSTASLGSGYPRKSFSTETPSAGTESSGPQQQSSNDSGSAGKEEKKGPIGWLKNKMREAKEEKRERDVENERERSLRALAPEHAASGFPGDERSESRDRRRPEHGLGAEVSEVPEEFRHVS